MMAADLSRVRHAVATVLDDVEHRGGDVRVDDLTHDSREAGPGIAYCAIRGANVDGHDHVDAAVEAGAPAVLVERFCDVGVPQLRVSDTRRAVGPAAAAVHGDPSRHMTVVGVTGTNGKTTTAYLLEGAFGAAGRGTGLVGTVETRVQGRARPGGRTTPEGADLQRLLAEMRGAGVSAVAMEVSSHGLALHRVDGTRFAVGVFTNLSQDHLDFHADLADYLAAKERLFTPDLTDRAVVCVDDDAGRGVAARTPLPTTTYGWHHGDVRITEAEADLAGTRGVLRGGQVDGLAVSTALVGSFNLTNAVGAVLAAIACGVDADVAARGVAAVDRVPGRLERVVDAGPAAFVDYAHTPDAVAVVIDTVRALVPPAGRLVVVLGAGGDRDAGKRGPMGRAAASADVVVVTSDNPRSEPPDVIAEAVASGVREARGDGDLEVVLDRREALGRALDLAGDDDVVLVLGKGHETTQDLGDRVVPFDDRLVLRELAP